MFNGRVLTMKISIFKNAKFIIGQPLSISCVSIQKKKLWLQKKSNMLKDITRLQLSKTPDILKSASALFVKKYEND